MKKIVFIIILLICIVILSKKQEIGFQKTKGVFISYIELSGYLKGKSESEGKKEIHKMVSNVKGMGMNTIILHVRPSMDAIYTSSLFPPSKYVFDDSFNTYDVLSYFIEDAHSSNIKLIAWVNPYRVLTKGTREDIPFNSPIYEKRNTRLVVEANGVFLNPAVDESRKIVLQGIDELLEYSVDGILMDDYFYPGENVDEEEYQNYLNTHSFLSKQDFHLQVINTMVREVHDHCMKKNVLFGISPEGNIQNNYQVNGADVRKWMQEDGFIDFIMPQLYYGFENSSKPFVKTLKEWQDLNERNIPLIPALAFYKVGTIDLYAKEGQEEWITHDNVIQKEVIHLKNQSDYQGFVLYRYDNIWNADEYTQTSKQEIKHLKNVIN